MPVQPKKTELETVIVWLEELLAHQEDVKEEHFQEYFERFPVVFETLGYERALSCVKGGDLQLPRDPHTGFKPEPDFLAL